MKAFEVTPLGVIPGIQVNVGKNPAIEVGHFFRRRRSVSAKLDTARFAEIPERIFNCDIVHGDAVRVLPESELTVKQYLIYWPHFAPGDFVFKTEGAVCKYLESVTERSDKSGLGKESGYALLAGMGMVENSSIVLLRRSSGWTRFWNDAVPELTSVASLTINADGQPTLNSFA